jgi:hypothetical protein
MYVIMLHVYGSCFVSEFNMWEMAKLAHITLIRFDTIIEIYKLILAIYKLSRLIFRNLKPSVILCKRILYGYIMIHKYYII